MNIRWQSTKPEDKLEYLCDLCGAPANTAHWLPWVVVQPEDEQTCVLACPDHDPGGYWMDLKTLFSDKPRTGLDHIGRKDRGERAVTLFAERIWEARQRESEQLSEKYAKGA